MIYRLTLVYRISKVEQVKRLLQIVNAVRPVKPVSNGVTKPYIIECDDGNAYYTKFKENPEGTRVLANEYVCALIAQNCNIPLSFPSLVQIDQEFISLYGHEINSHLDSSQSISPGIHFGTKKINKAFTITNSKMLEMTNNIEIIPDIILFDQLICNNDRAQNGGNLLIDGSSKNIIVIDHSHVFEIGALWDAHQLKFRIGKPFEPFVQDGYVFRKLVPFVKGHTPFASILARIKSLTTSNLNDYITSIPQEWNIPEEDKKMLHSYLCDRLERIDEALPILKLQFPYWKGGV